MYYFHNDKNINIKMTLVGMGCLLLSIGEGGKEGDQLG